VLKVGQEVDTMVVGVDRENKKIALSIKRLQPEPWTGVEQRYQVGQIVTGRITKLASFGAFARIEEGVEGLIHISELSDERIAHPKSVVKEGDEVSLRIIRIDAARHRLGLSLKQAQGEGDDERGPGEGAEAAATPVERADVGARGEEEGDGMAHKVPSPGVGGEAVESEGEAAQSLGHERRDREGARTEKAPAEQPVPEERASESIPADGTTSMVLGTQ